MENNASSRSYLAGEKKSEEISLYQLPSRIGYLLLQEITKKRCFGTKNSCQTTENVLGEVYHQVFFACADDIVGCQRILERS